MSARARMRGPHPAHVKWTAAQLALMGKLPDIDVAARAGVSPSAVARERRRRGIARWNGRRDPVEWTEPMLSLLGTDTDANVAAVLGIHPASVNHRRRVLGIPSFGLSPARSRSKIVWSRRALALLGTAPDAAVARKLRLTHAVVWWKRQLLGVPSFEPARRIRWTPSVVKRFGKEPDRRIARDLGVLPTTVKYKREALGIPPFQYAAPIVRTARWKTLLKLTNPELAKRFRMSSKAIAKLRHDYGIPAPGRPTWTPDVLRRLGKQSDVSIARELGIQSPSVLYKRRRLGIPRWERGRRWEKSDLRLLGRSSDVDVARRLGVSVNLVRVRRKALGVAPYRTVAPIEKSPRLKDVLRLPNRELGERYGLSPDVIHRLRRQHGISAPGRPPVGRWTGALVARLGRESDAHLARELGIDQSSVWSKRRALGIPPAPAARIWTKAECRLLGRLPDRQIARRLGLSAECVGQKRRDLGIPCAPLGRRPGG